MAISRLEKSILEAQGVTPKKAAKMVVPTEYEVEKYSSAVYLEEEQKILKIKPSDWTQYAFRMLNKDTNKFENFNFNGQRYWIPIYDSDAKRILCKTARQVAKSTFLGNKALTYCCLQLGFHVLYVAPSQMQQKEWMNTRINQPIKESEVLKKFEDHRLVNNTILREFITGSKINFRASFISAERVRGLSSVDCLMLDEIQSLLTSNIAIIEQTTFASNKKYRYFLYSGTPKSLENPIEEMWSDLSTQNEWAIPCHRHSYHSSSGRTNIHWNFIVDDKVIGLKSLICERCGEKIDAQDPLCHWVSLNPSVKEKQGIIPFEGFHLAQPMSPFADWATIIHDRNTNPKAQFYNETLGLSFDHGDKPITKQDLIDNCREDLSMSDASLEALKESIFDGRQIFAGIDHAGGSDRSLTVLSLATYIDGFFTYFYLKKYTGPEADLEYQIKDIIQKCREWRITCIACDFGGGMWPNNRLSAEFGASKVFKYQYAAPKHVLRWEPNLGRFVLHRSEILSAFFGAIKRRDQVRFPKWDEFEPFAKDFLSVTTNYNETTRMLVYQHSLAQPDDTVHSCCLNLLGSMIFIPKRDLIRPDKVAGYYEEMQYV